MLTKIIKNFFSSKALVLGCGLIGRPIALDLSSDFDVSCADVNPKALEKLAGTNVKPIQAELTNTQFLQDLIKNYDIVVNATSSAIGYSVTKTVIESQKNLVDIAFYIEDPYNLKEVAQNVQGLTDFGVAPGLSNLLFAHGSKMLDETVSATCYVGGVPKIRKLPYEYKSPFSPIDVLEEYTRPARLMEHGQVVVKDALSDLELIDIPNFGTLEAFNTDGLRSLLRMKIPHMKEKTLRYPGYVAKIELLKQTGFFRTDEIDVKGVKIKPIDVASKLLFPLWQLEEGEIDITIMKIIVEGKKAGKKLKINFDIYDEYDPNTKIHSMARTTGYTATAGVRMIMQGILKKKGFFFAEEIVDNPNCTAFILEELKKRNVNVKETIEEIQ